MPKPLTRASRDARQKQVFARSKGWGAGWEPVFDHAFAQVFEPAVAEAQKSIGGSLTLKQYYGVIAVIHDLCFNYACIATGIRKPGRSAHKQ